VADHIDKRALRFMGGGRAYALLSRCSKRFADAGLSEIRSATRAPACMAGLGGRHLGRCSPRHNFRARHLRDSVSGRSPCKMHMSSTSARNLSTLSRFKVQSKLFDHLGLALLAALHR